MQVVCICASLSLSPSHLREAHKLGAQALVRVVGLDGAPGEEHVHEKVNIM